MMQTEVYLLLALGGIYANDCVHWIKPDEEAFTRAATNWKRHRVEPLSMTLLGRAPVFADPLLLRPGFVRARQADSSLQATKRALHRVGRRLDALWVLQLQCQLQAMLLLLYLPCILWTHRLTYLWKPFLTALGISHLLLMLSYAFALRYRARRQVATAVAPLLLNPLGACRLFDGMTQMYFEEQMARRPHRPMKAHSKP